MSHAIPGKFPCFKCGCCCRNVSQDPQLSAWATADGACRYFDLDTNECVIYDARPDVCNVWKCYRADYESVGATWDDFVFTNMLNCAALRYAYGVPEPAESPFEGAQEEIAKEVLYDLQHQAELPDFVADNDILKEELEAD